MVDGVLLPSNTCYYPQPLFSNEFFRLLSQENEVNAKVLRCLEGKEGEKGKISILPRLVGVEEAAAEHHLRHRHPPTRWGERGRPHHTTPLIRSLSAIPSEWLRSSPSMAHLHREREREGQRGRDRDLDGNLWEWEWARILILFLKDNRDKRWRKYFLILDLFYVYLFKVPFLLFDFSLLFVFCFVFTEDWSLISLPFFFGTAHRLMSDKRRKQRGFLCSTQKSIFMVGSMENRTHFRLPHKIKTNTSWPLTPRGWWRNGSTLSSRWSSSLFYLLSLLFNVTEYLTCSLLSFFSFQVIGDMEGFDAANLTIKLWEHDCVK